MLSIYQVLSGLQVNDVCVYVCVWYHKFDKSLIFHDFDDVL